MKIRNKVKIDGLIVKLNLILLPFISFKSAKS